MNTALVVGHELPCPSGWMSRNVDGGILGVTSTSNSNFLACKPTASACGIIAGGGSAPRSDAPVAHSLPLYAVMASLASGGYKLHAKFVFEYKPGSCSLRGIGARLQEHEQPLQNQKLLKLEHSYSVLAFEVLLNFVRGRNAV